MKKDPHEVEKEEKGSYQAETHTSSRGHSRGGEYHGLGAPPWGVTGLPQMLGSHPGDPTPGWWVPLAGMKTSEIYMGLEETQTPFMKSVHAFSPTTPYIHVSLHCSQTNILYFAQFFV